MNKVVAGSILPGAHVGALAVACPFQIVVLFPHELASAVNAVCWYFTRVHHVDEDACLIQDEFLADCVNEHKKERDGPRAEFGHHFVLVIEVIE